MNKKNKPIVIAIIILALLIIILIYINIRLTGAAILDKQNNANTFLFQDEFKVTKLEEIDYLLEGFLGDRPFLLHLRKDPREAQLVPSEPDIRFKTLKDTEAVYVTLAPDLSAKAIIAASEITKITGEVEIMNIPTRTAVTDNLGREDVLVKTCQDSTRNERVIHLKITKETKIYSEGDCIIVEGTDEEELIRASDKLMLQLLGIL